MKNLILFLSGILIGGTVIYSTVRRNANNLQNTNNTSEYVRIQKYTIQRPNNVTAPIKVAPKELEANKPSVVFSEIANSLIETLENGELSSKFASIESLGNLGDPRATPYLIDILKRAKNRQLVKRAELALVKLGAAAIPIIENEYLNWKEEDGGLALKRLSGVLGDIGYAGISSLKNIAKNVKLAGDQRNSAIWELGRSGFPETKPILYELLEERDKLIVVSAATALGVTNDPRGFPILLDLINHKDYQTMRQAAFGLSHYAYNERYIVEAYEQLVLARKRLKEVGPNDDSLDIILNRLRQELRRKK